MTVTDDSRTSPPGGEPRPPRLRALTGPEGLDPLLRRRARGMMVRGARLCRALGLKGAARTLLVRAGPDLPNSRLMRQTVSAVFAGHPMRGRIAELRVAHLMPRVHQAVARRDYEALLRLAAEFEALERPLPLAAGDALARQIVSQPGRARLRQAAERAREAAPDSPLLLYILSMVTAEEGDPAAASALLSAALRATTEAAEASEAGTEAERARARRRFASLRDSWRVTDQIAREATGWADDAEGGSYADLALVGAGAEGARISFKEPLLQGRDEAGYLAACRAEFEAQSTLADRLRLIAETTRQGLRRQPSYARAWAQAGDCYDGLRAEVLALAAGADPAAGEAATLGTLRTLIAALGVLRTLGRDGEAAALKRAIVDFADRATVAGRLPEAFWMVLPELVAEDEPATGLAPAPAGGPAVEPPRHWAAESRRLRRALPALPRREHELKAYLRWALRIGAFAEADRVFRSLPAGLRRTRAALYHVNILQRQGRFGEARRVLAQVNAAMLARPDRLRPHEHWSLLRRNGELRFLADTARLLGRVPQSRSPKGVVILAARNVDQLRKYPLAVLMEMRRRGWAVVNLVEGLMPRTRTGRPEIDLLSGCITMDGRLAPHARAVFPPLPDFLAEPAAGRLAWGGIDLTHPLTEDARIARRAYDVDFSCPALQRTLGRLCDWTAVVARALEQARRTLGPGSGRPGREPVRVACLSLFNSRLPDILFRAYCERHGDPDRFFALQTGNGYENYFANFRHPVATRCVIRNVTRHPEARSATFPLPGHFARYVEANRHRGPEILERVEAIANARRMPAGGGAAPEAVACLDRIDAWRAQGGRVACLFGRVVCDSAVPFDGGPVHADLRDWLNDTIEAVRGSDTLLLIKPHPHELNEQIATYLNQYFGDLIDGLLPENAIFLGHRWFGIDVLAPRIDLGTVYNGTVAVELALQGVPCLQMNHFGPIDYPLGHPLAATREDYHALLRFERPAAADPDLRLRAALWLDYMSNGRFALDYRYHARPVTNRVVYPPWWIEEDVARYVETGDPNVTDLALRAIGAQDEPDR